MIYISQTNEVRLSADTFKKMPNLIYLKIYSTADQLSCNVHLPNGLESFSNKISYLEWIRYPLKSLPSNFCPKKLVELQIPESHVEKLWDGVQVCISNVLDFICLFLFYVNYFHNDSRTLSI